MSRRPLPDSMLPPITPPGTGAPKIFPLQSGAMSRRRQKSIQKDRMLQAMTLGERGLDAERRRQTTERMKARGFVPGNPGNSGGKKGRSGRRPDIWLRWCQKLMLNRGTQRAIRRVIRDKSHPAYGTITKMIRDSAFPIQKQLDVTMRTSLEDILAASHGGPPTR